MTIRDKKELCNIMSPERRRGKKHLQESDLRPAASSGAQNEEASQATPLLMITADL